MIFRIAAYAIALSTLLLTSTVLADSFTDSPSLAELLKVYDMNEEDRKAYLATQGIVHDKEGGGALTTVYKKDVVDGRLIDIFTVVSLPPILTINQSSTKMGTYLFFSNIRKDLKMPSSEHISMKTQKSIQHGGKELLITLSFVDNSASIKFDRPPLTGKDAADAEAAFLSSFCMCAKAQHASDPYAKGPECGLNLGKKYPTLIRSFMSNMEAFLKKLEAVCPDVAKRMAEEMGR